MTGYKVMKRTLTNVFRTDGQSDQYRAFATMWRVPDNLLHVVFFYINAPFGSDYFVLISQHNLGEKNYYIAIPPLFAKGGENLLYIAIFPPIQVRGKNGYGGKMALQHRIYHVFRCA